MIVTKEKAAIRRASYDCNVESTLGRIATKRLYHRVSRLVKPLFAIILVFCFVYVLTSAFAVRHPELEAIEYRVGAGDTLWEVAKQYKPDGMTMDEYMGWIYEHNDGGLIYPGDVVTIGVAK